MRKYECKYDIEFQNLKEIMDFVAEKYGNNTGFIYKSADRKTKTEVTYKTFREDIDTLGAYLISKGLKGKKIAVMGSNSYTKVRAKKYTNRGAEFVEDGTVEIALGEGNVFADIPVLVKGETNVIEFWSEKNQVYYQRDLTIDLAAGTATFDPHKATVDDLEGLTDEEALDFVTKNANVNLMNSLIEAIQVQQRYDDIGRIVIDLFEL